MSDRQVTAELHRLVAERAQHCVNTAAHKRGTPRTPSQSTISFRAHWAGSRPRTTWLWRVAAAISTRDSSANDPITDAVVPLFHPRRQKWQEHFAWNNDFTLIVGLTHIGRATVSALKLNRPGLVNLRRVLYSIGEHPPK